ncbi:MAG: Phenylpropionate dioxygenase [uncultured Sulfurovum sp.]|uniref:Phenylpropionate dioxygenase n=1 Tax=uncultured Sulfurovum sp. TaxID=269237 RepID=A0A6S6TGH2_9BACT|nr:MAG: Phenylpropionate dioxygenase [uncultured Sulfurovum sp.]
MNVEKLKGYWYSLFESKELKVKPLSKTLLGVALVFFRSSDGIKCFKNQCPHRGVALSNGSVVNDELQCHYHGWTFDREGDLSRVPACVGSCPKKVSLEVFSVIEHDTLVWVRLEGERSFASAFVLEEGFVNSRHIKVIEGDFMHSIENFLDPTHTSFIHKGLLRSESRQGMNIRQETSEEGFVTHYDLVDKQNGLINKLFDKGVNKNRVTFSLPSFAKIEYLKDEVLLFCVSIFFVPLKKGKVQMVVDVSLPKSMMPNWLVFALLRPFLELALYQDKKILKEQYESTKSKVFEYEVLESDLVIDHLLYLLADGEKGVDKQLYMEW